MDTSEGIAIGIMVAVVALCVLIPPVGFIAAVIYIIGEATSD